MSQSLVQSLIASPRAICHVGHARYTDDHQQSETVTPSARLLYLIDGKLDYHYPTHIHQYHAGQIWLVPQLMRRHWRVCCKRAELIWVEFVHLLPVNLNLSFEPVVADALDQALFERLAQCGDTSLIEQPSLLELLLVRYAIKAKQGTATDGMHVHPAVSQVLHWLSRQLDQPIAIDKLHEQAQLSANHFRKLFKQATDMNPTQYVQMLRLRKARYLLVTTSLSIQEVGYAVGYEDPLHFSKQYRQCWGVSPKQDRASTP